MKKFLVLLAFSASLLMPTAKTMAADLETLPPPPIEHLRPAAYDWTGAYIGAWAGLACIDGTLVDNTGGKPYLNAGCGYKGGGLMGYNHQIGDTVFGAEFDLGTTSDLVHNIDPTADFSFRLDYLATARARVGYAMDDTLFFVTGGGAWAQGDINGIISATPNHLRANEFGWSLGAGVEHAISDNFRVRVDYLYTHMIDTHYSDVCCNVDIHWGGEHEVRAAAIWAF